jgi:D-threo-aldose 1-dehydrogenase
MILQPTRQHLRLGTGGAGLGNLFTAISDDAAHAVLKAALSQGCNTFDTAPHYGNGLSEHRFGRALRHLPRDSFVLSSKVGRILVADSHAPRAQNSYVEVLPYRQRWDFSAAGMRRSVEDSLQRLGLARLDVAYIHDCDASTHGTHYPQVLKQVLREALPELQRMKTEGLLRHVGMGVNDVQVCLDVLAQADLDCLLLAGRYSLIDHSALAELLPLCLQRGVRVALGGVFNSGILATGVKAVHDPNSIRFNYAPAPQAWLARVAAVEAVCDEFAVPLRAAAIQFPLAHPAVEIVVAGPQTVAHLQDAVAMMSHPIADDFWAALRARGLLPDTAPTPSRPMSSAAGDP